MPELHAPDKRRQINANAWVGQSDRIGALAIVQGDNNLSGDRHYELLVHVMRMAAPRFADRNLVNEEKTFGSKWNHALVCDR